MASNAYAATKALIDLLTTAVSPVQCTFGWPGRNVQRECVYSGKVAGPHTDLAFRAGGRRPRLEDLTLDLHVQVHTPGATTADVAARALVIGAIVENTIADNITLGGTVPGLLAATVVGFEQDSGAMDDDAAMSLITYQVALKSQLT